MANEGLKHYAREKRVYQWRVAQAWGLSEPQFIRILRNEFSEEQSRKFKQIVDELAFHDEQKRKEREA